MRPKITISGTELSDLKRRGWSNRRLSIKFGVSEATIKRRLRCEIHFDALAMAAQLDWLANKAAAFADKLRAAAEPGDVKKSKILHSITTGARTVSEIADDCALSKTEIVDALHRLLREKKIYSTKSENHLGRKKNLYFPC